MTTYTDSSAPVPVYVQERFSKAARRAVKTAGQVPFTQLLQLEVRNAFELLVSRNLITRDECRQILERLKEDLDTQRLITPSLDLDPVFTRAGERSNCTPRSFWLAAWIIHVAAAHVASRTKFVAADDRQLAVAKASGLEVVDIKPRRRQKKP